MSATQEGNGILGGLTVSEHIPERLENSFDLEIFVEMDEFNHRGDRCEARSLVNYLCSGVAHAMVNQGTDRTRTDITEASALDELLELLAKRYPTWFGDEEALSNIEETFSEEHLSVDDLRDRYYDGELSLPGEKIKYDMESKRNVAVPVTGLFLDAVKEQMEADKEALTSEAQTRIKRTIIDETIRAELSPEEIQTAVAEATERIDERSTVWDE